MSNKKNKPNFSDITNSDNPNKYNTTSIEDDVFFPSSSRIAWIIGLFVVLLCFVFVRLIVLCVVDAEENKAKAIETRTISYKTSPKRGTIYDRNGNVLAVSKDATTIYANPSEIDNVNSTAKTIANTLGGDVSQYQELISDNTKTFAYIKRKVDIDVANSLQEKNLSGIYFIEDSKREYPYGSCGGQIVGACNIDGDGLCGIELYYDDILRGSSGKTIAQQGMDGMPIPGGVVQQIESIDGQDIMLTVDIELQQKVESTLVENNQKLGSQSMNSVVMDSETGEIYAAASLPLFDPSNIQNTEEGATDIKSISSTYEPGSTFKVVSATSILENNVLTPDSVLYCPNSIDADEYEVSDAHDRADQSFTLRQIIARSSNVGISLATEKMGYDKLYESILRYNVTDYTNVDFPGDTCGYVSDEKNWSKIQSYNVSFGQGITTTPLAMVRFYSALNNNGLEPTPHFLMRYLQTAKDEEYPREDVINNKSAIEPMLSMMESVVNDEDGTGSQARIDGYNVVGKTGTAEMADDNGKYIGGIYYNSFIGMLRDVNTPLICSVGAERIPSESSVTSIYKDITQFCIERLRIVPDTN